MEAAILMKSLGEPMRFTIFQQLLIRKHYVRSLSKKLGITEAAISQHMKVLREAGLVYGEKYGYHTHYLPCQDAVDCLATAFEQMQQQSLRLDRDPKMCECEFRKEEEAK